MARSTTKDLKAAVRYMFSQRFGLTNEIGYPGGITPNASISPSNVDHCFDNNKSLAWSDAADTTNVPVLSCDINNRIHLDRQATYGAREQAQYYVNANASLATQTFHIADRAQVITNIQYEHNTAGTASGAVTAVVTHDTGTQVPGTGTVVMTNTFNCKGTANVVQYATLLAVGGDGDVVPGLTLAAGDRLSIVFTGTLTTLAGVVCTVGLTAGQTEQYAQYNSLAGTPVTQGFFLANRDMMVVGVQAVWSTPTSGSGTINVTHETSTTAPGSGTSILVSGTAIAPNTTANTVNNFALTATAATLQLNAGDRLSLKVTGSVTALAGLVIIVYLQALTPNALTGTGYYGQVDINFNLQANSVQGTQSFFVADRDYEVVDASFIASAAGTDGGTVTGEIDIDKGTTAAGSGTTIASTTANFNLKSTANTTQVATLSVSRRNRLLSQGDRLTFTTAGTLTTVAGVDVTVSLLPR